MLLRGLVQDLGEVRDGDLCLLEALVEAGGLQDGLRGALRDHRVGDEAAHRHRARHDLLGAEREDQDARQLGHELHASLCVGAHHGRVERCPDVGGEALVPEPAHRGLDGGGLDGLHPHDGLDDELLRAGHPAGLLLQEPPEERAHEDRDADVQGHQGEDGRGQEGRVERHHGEVDAHEEHVYGRREALVGEEAADALDLAHARDHHTGLAALEVRHRQAHEVGVELGPEFDVDARRGVAEGVGPYEAEHGLEHGDERHRGDHDDEGRLAPRHEHLVDHELEDERRGEAEQVDEERQHEDVRERPPVPPDHGHEP